MPRDKRSVEEALALAEERLAAARHLLEAGYHADAIGRAYYGMFLAARALLATRSIFPRTHRGVIAQFGLEFVKRGLVEELHGQALARAKERREELEYGVPQRIAREEAEAIVGDAAHFVARIREATAGMG